MNRWGFFHSVQLTWSTAFHRKTIQSLVFGSPGYLYLSVLYITNRNLELITRMFLLTKFADSPTWRIIPSSNRSFSGAELSQLECGEHDKNSLCPGIINTIMVKLTLW